MKEETVLLPALITISTFKPMISKFQQIQKYHIQHNVLLMDNIYSVQAVLADDAYLSEGEFLPQGPTFENKKV